MVAMGTRWNSTHCQRGHEKTPYNWRSNGKQMRCFACMRERSRPLNRATMLKSRYGMTLREYHGMLAIQGNQCAICRSEDPGVHGVFHVDHDHDTGVVRGLLCHSCNTSLRSPMVMRAALEYLALHQ